MKTLLIIYMAVVSDIGNEQKNWYHELRIEHPTMESCKAKIAEVSDFTIAMGDTEISIRTDCILES
jgi:hypothetical protein